MLFCACKKPSVVSLIIASLENSTPSVLITLYMHLHWEHQEISLVLWNSAIFSGRLVETQSFGIIVEFTSVNNNAAWYMVNVYGPCQGVQRDHFVSWLYNLDVQPDRNWLLLGDFNFIRSTQNRNRPGGNFHGMFLFNEIIGHPGLIELPLKGRSFTWSNMQSSPLLE